MHRKGKDIMGDTKAYKVKAAADCPENNKNLLAYGQLVLTKTTAANLNPVPPALADLNAALPLFAAAITSAETQKGMSATVLETRHAVVEALLHLADQVTAAARKQPVEAGQATVQATGLRLKKVGIRVKLPLAARYGVSSTVLLVARAAAKRATYFWEFGTDGAHWTDVPSTMKADTTITGLTPGTLYYFRFRAQTRKGMGDWSQSITLIAH